MMDKAKAAQEIVSEALKHVPFDGWTQSTLATAAQNVGYRRTDAIRIFPGGAIDAINFYFLMTDAQMESRLKEYDLEHMKIREKVMTGVRIKLEIMQPHKEAVRRALAQLAIPFNARHGLENLYHTVDTIWHAIGDTSTDFNFYSKRLTLAGVVSSTMLYWLDDDSAGHAATLGFLERRVENVMMIEKAKHQIRKRFANYF